MPTKIHKALIAENSRVSHDIFRLRLNIKDKINPLPGQFYMVGVSHTKDPLLKRPLSLYNHDDGTIEFIYRIRGRGTELLSRFKAGDYLEILGPCGRGYPVPSQKESIIICAGGLGAASLNILIKSLVSSGHDLTVLYGVKTASDIFPLEYQSILYVSEDGSTGEKGMITDALKKIISQRSFHRYYACGPLAMLRNIKSIMSEKGIEGYMSLEERMACGFGACLGCAVMTRNGYKRVCSDGPVFSSGEVLL